VTAPGPDAPDIEDWDQKVDAFPVEKFCDEIASTGAGWLIFPIGHSSGIGTYCSPNAVLEESLPGHCSKRDLFREIADNYCDEGCTLRMATLEDVFLKLTGRDLRE